MKKIIILIFITELFLVSCSTVRESAGVNRKVIDEYTVIENPPLIIPPDFNLLPPEQIESKKIDEVEKDLAKEILFGLENTENQNTSDNSLLFAIIEEAQANEVDDSIRESINKEFANEKSSIKDETKFQSDNELNQAIKDTKEKGSNNKNLNKKEKKKKRFFFF